VIRRSLPGRTPLEATSETGRILGEYSDNTTDASVVLLIAPPVHVFVAFASMVPPERGETSIPGPGTDPGLRERNVLTQV